MKNRDGSISNGYITGSDFIEDLYIHSWYTVGDKLAKEIGLLFFVKHFIITRTKRLYLIIRRKLK